MNTLPKPWVDEFTLLLPDVLAWQDGDAAEWIARLDQDLRHDPGSAVVLLHRNPWWVIVQRVMIPRAARKISFEQSVALLDELHRLADHSPLLTYGKRAPGVVEQLRQHLEETLGKHGLTLQDVGLHQPVA